MPLATLAPIEGRPFFKRSAIALCLVIALAAAHSWILIVPLALAFSVPALATSLIVGVPGTAVLAGFLALGALLRTIASRILSLGLPVALTAVALLLVMSDLRLMPQLGGSGWRILYGNVWTTVGFLGALGIMKPVSDLRTDKAALGIVVVAALIGIDHFSVLIWPMMLPGANYGSDIPWTLRALTATGVPELLRIPSSALLGLLLLGLGYAQSRTAPAAPLWDFPPLSIGWQVLTAVIAGFGLCAALYASTAMGPASEPLLRWLVALAISGWLYAVPLFFLLGLVASRGSKAIWAAFTIASLLPLATWFGQRILVDHRATEAAAVNAKPFAWSDVPTQGRPLMVSWANKELDEKARQRGFAGTYGFRSTSTRSWYARQGEDRATIDYDGPDNFIEIALGAHHPGKRFAAEGWHPRQPTTLHVYDVRDGKRTLLGTRIVERYQVPAFPPQIQIDGAWLPDPTKTREPREEAMIMRIVDEIPPR